MEPTLTSVPQPQPARPPVARGRRLAGLDGIRGLAALFVVMHHSWLVAWPGFPKPEGPGWAAWMAYGHFAVVVFIVLSGFSLAVSPARSDWKLDGVRKFARRRAWRILPPYWAALVFSLAIAWLIVPQPGEGTPTAKSVAVFGALLQDVTGSPSPNGAFWSIAVEAHLYFLFPVMLLVLRKAGAIALLCALTVPVALIGALAPHSGAVHEFMRFSPQFAVLFGVGVVAARVVEGTRPGRPYAWAALAAAIPVLLLITISGEEWTIGHLFWVDLAWGPAIGLLLAAIACGRPAPLVTALDVAPLRRLGSFSYSLYLIHAPIVIVLGEKVVVPNVRAGVPTMLAVLALALPISLVAAYLFASVFELPFQRHRSWAALRTALRHGR